MKVEGVLNEIAGNSLKARSKENSSIGLLFYLDQIKDFVRRRETCWCSMQVEFNSVGNGMKRLRYGLLMSKDIKTC